MVEFQDLIEFLKHWAGTDPLRISVTTTVASLASAVAQLEQLIARGPLAGSLGEIVDRNADGDHQKLLDRTANELIIAALRAAPVQCLCSEESNDVVILDPNASLAVAIDPLDGSSNIETNSIIGTIFSILPAAGADTFLQQGRTQLAAGFVIYGAQTALAFTLGDGTHLATLDPTTGRFAITARNVRIASGTPEFAINASNYRFWPKPVRAFFDDCIAGADGPRSTDYNMRWIAALVAEAYRILVRGGVFLYPGDDRKGYGAGRLRLIYEAWPIAFLIEQAGGAASDGTRPILDLVASDLHQRTPLVFGDADEVARIGRYHVSPPVAGAREPLFGQRGLFRA